MKKLLLFVATLMLSVAALAQSGADTYVWQTIAGGPVSLDPIRAYDSASGTILENVYETLYTYDGAAIDEFVPSLATEYTTNEDGSQYTFTLREGVPFHSGNTMTCKDVEYSYEYGLVAAPSEGATVYLMGDQLLGQHEADGSDPAAYQEAVSWETISGAVECPDGPDGLTVQFNLAQPDPAFIAIQAYTAFSIIDSEFAKSNGMWDGTEETWTEWIGRDLTQEFLHDNVSGTGPYQLVEWSDQQTILEAFPDYWDGAPEIQNVVVQYVEEQSSRILALQQGDADRITVLERSALVQLEGAEGVTIAEDPSWSPTTVTTIFFNYDIDTENNEDVGSGQLDGQGIPSDFFTDENVRKGFAHLFDQQAFVDQLYDGQGIILTEGLPPSFAGYNEEVDVRTLDLEQAEQFFREAFGGELWETGFEFTALYNSGNTNRQTALEIIAENLAFLNPNFSMNVRGLPWSDYLARTDQGKTPMFALGWGADYADPSNFIDTFYSNSGFYSSRTSIDLAPIQEIIDEASETVDLEARAELYRQVAPLHYELAPLIAVPQQSPFMPLRDNLEGWYYNPMLSSNFLFKDITKN